MTTGLFVGRFQPFHNAHLIDIKNIYKDIDNLIIVIGSSQYFNLHENPFTADERKAMIELALKNEKIKNYKIFSLNDIADDRRWVEHVKIHIPRFDIVFTGNPKVMNLFKEKGYPVKKVNLIKNISGTIIRKKILNNLTWENDIPKSVVKFIKRIDGVERIKRIDSY